ncbi:MAG: glycoside hydrolase family 2 [Clostridia bacterium]|nr:glycoside hydrolase family 2 [Clostridia bacterium]
MIFKPQFIDGANAPFLEYPRPQFKRDSYLNLNGEWDYAITNANVKPDFFEGKIIVPFSPESKNSKVNRQLKPNEFLHYKRTFTLPDGFNKGRVLLNIGAIDQISEIYINGIFLKRFEGGYYSFSVDITTALYSGENELYILVKDDASSDIFGRGKQKYKRGGIWYTATSGIWQSVWLESVPNDYLKSFKLYPNYDDKTLKITFDAPKTVKTIVYDGDEVVAEKISSNNEVVLDVSKCNPWSPENPELYKLVFETGEDVVESYFGLRKFSLVEKNGKKFIAVNNKPTFNNGLLDQGYWLDGLYTPSDNYSMYSELQNIKNLGFNMLRKHIKTEPYLWYYYCDILGILVWQDMINGGGEYPFFRLALCPFFNLNLDDTNYKKMKRSEKSKEQYFKEADLMIEQLFNTVSLCLWTPFNECWGQFDAENVYYELSKKDETRLFDHASGWQDKGVSDLNSKHIYFRKLKLKNDYKRALAVTEFGGYSCGLKGHIFTNKKFGYKFFNSTDKLEKAYEKLYLSEVIPAIKNQGLSATVYTQLADVEDEINGLYTYDRVLKISTETIKKVNDAVYDAFNKSLENL